MTTTTTPQEAANQATTDSILAMFDVLATPATGPEPVHSMNVYFSAMAKNRKGGWQVATKRGCLIQHTELRAATDQASAEAAAAKLFVVVAP